MIFSDETIEELYPSRRMYVRRPPITRYHHRCITLTAKFGTKRVMFWGFIKFSGERNLVVVDGNMNSTKYCEILRNHLMDEMYMHEIFQQDNASCHKSRETINFFSRKWFLRFGGLAPSIPRFEHN